MFYFISLIANLIIIFILKSRKKVKFVKYPHIQNIEATFLGLGVAFIIITIVMMLAPPFSIMSAKRVGYAGMVESIALVNAYVILSKSMKIYRIIAVVVISSIFAWLHFYTFDANIILMVTAFIFGVICLLASISAKSYFPAIMIHAIWNVLTVM